MVILLISHIVIACSGIALATISLLYRSDRAIQWSYALTAATLVSGTGLVILKPESIIKSCLSGLLYVVVVLGITRLAQLRLAAEKIQ